MTATRNTRAKAPEAAGRQMVEPKPNVKPRADFETIGLPTPKTDRPISCRARFFPPCGVRGKPFRDAVVEALAVQGCVNVGDHTAEWIRDLALELGDGRLGGLPF